MKDWTSNMSRLIWIYAVCKSLLLSPVAVKQLTEIKILQTEKFYNKKF